MKSALLETPPPSAPAMSGATTFIDAFDGRYACIANCDRLAPFLMNIVSSSDLWLFVASNGGVTAGRVNVEQAIFPYQTVDRIYDSAGSAGPFTAIRVLRGDESVLWEPFAAHTARVHRVVRNLYKSVEGDRVWFEEVNPELGLVFRYGWATSERHGLVRRCELESLAEAPVSLAVLDGVRNVLPSGISSRLQADFSCLGDAYKTAELLPPSSLAIYALSSLITDQATPAESLRASAVGSEGLPHGEILLSEKQFAAFHGGGRVTTETKCRGIRGVYAVASRLTLAPRATQRWLLVADTGLSQSDVVARRQALASGALVETVAAGVEETTSCLRHTVAVADGLQASAAEHTTTHHFANTLFNVMRGGVFAFADEIPAADFRDFIRVRNRVVADRHAAWLAAFSGRVNRAALLEELSRKGDRDLERLGYEYLPLAFSRRHGDPSRPWNAFTIRTRDAAGERALHYEGNWRDIFQNWEALCVSFPEFFESIITKFLNASTADGYNPYRVSRSGIEWEVPEPDHPWAGIGYWGDHQTVYLLKLLEGSARFHPGALDGWLREPRFSYANVPYRIASYEKTLANPRDTIAFDDALHRRILRRVAELGTDAKLLCDASGQIVHVNLTEKLLLLALTRLTNFVPGGGIWMNTQRPEWNDANNALVGNGVSIVTLAYLRRFLEHVRHHLLPALRSEPVAVSRRVAVLLRAVRQVLVERSDVLTRAQVSDEARREIVDRLGAIGSNFRAAVYAGEDLAPSPVQPAEIEALVASALAWIDHTLCGAKRADGLYEAYLVLEFTSEPRSLKLHSLAPMLEGQVAVLSSGLLRPDEAAKLLRCLRESALYRADQHSYLLYPNRDVPGLLERNIIAEELVAGCPLVVDLLAAGDAQLAVRDLEGRVRFHADLANATVLDRRLAVLAQDEHWSAAVKAGADDVRRVYEAVFHHHRYTGRSGSMFGYEGLGSIYWHMVAKLLLAVQENVDAAVAAKDPAAAELARHYHDIRDGLGFNKSPAAYGAFPTDPYSHTPAHAGAQQPGMTGQVKEELLTRLGELGVHVTDGRITFNPYLLRGDEFTRTASALRLPKAIGADERIDLPVGSIAFTFCGVPVLCRRVAGASTIRMHFADGTTSEVPGLALAPGLSAEIFRRSGRITRLEIRLGSEVSLFAS